MSDHPTKDSERAQLDELILKGLIGRVGDIDTRLGSVETGKPLQGGVGGANSLTRMRDEIAMLRAELNQVNMRAGNMRLDRQIRLTFRRLLGIEKRALKKHTRRKTELLQERKRAAARNSEQMTVATQLLVICPAYPGGQRAYGGEFVQRRAEAYAAAGIELVVIEASSRTTELQRHSVNGVDVLRINPAGLGKVLRLSTINTLAIHSPEKPVWSVVEPYLTDMRAICWLHGFESRPWEELAFNYSEADLETLRPRLDKANAERRQTIRSLFQHPNVDVVFVSEFMKGIAEEFVGLPANRAHIIHNSISPLDFPYREKTANDRLNFLWVRTFAAHNYANDISRDVILGLSEKPYFNELSFSIFGDGKYFEEMTAPLQHFPNVSITQNYLSREGMREAHAQHGIKIVPSRWDSQGLTCGEAMHSGLVPMTSSVAGLPEFVDPDTAILAPRDDATALIEGYDRIYSDPEIFLAMSKKASQRAMTQCGPDNTLSREIDLIQSSIETVSSSLEGLNAAI